jgi:hypothetical protein
MHTRFQGEETNGSSLTPALSLREREKNGASGIEPVLHP